MDLWETLTMSDLSFSKQPRVPRSLAATLVGLFLASAAMAQEPGQGTAHRAPAEGPRIWWNQSRFVDGLALTGDQRGGMDEILERHLQARRDKGRLYRLARAEVARAAQAGHWEAAGAASVRLGEAGAELARLEGDFVVGVLRLLTADQRAKLKDGFPMILRRPWLLGGLAR